MGNPRLFARSLGLGLAVIWLPVAGALAAPGILHRTPLWPADRGELNLRMGQTLAGGDADLLTDQARQALRVRPAGDEPFSHLAMAGIGAAALTGATSLPAHTQALAEEARRRDPRSSLGGLSYAATLLYRSDFVAMLAEARRMNRIRPKLRPRIRALMLTMATLAEGRETILSLDADDPGLALAFETFVTDPKHPLLGPVADRLAADPPSQETAKQLSAYYLRAGNMPQLSALLRTRFGVDIARPTDLPAVSSALTSGAASQFALGSRHNGAVRLSGKEPTLDFIHYTEDRLPLLTIPVATNGRPVRIDWRGTNEGGEPIRLRSEVECVASGTREAQVEDFAGSHALVLRSPDSCPYVLVRLFSEKAGRETASGQIDRLVVAPA